MKCRKCGTEFSEGIFCPICGTKNEDIRNDAFKRIHEEAVQNAKCEEEARQWEEATIKIKEAKKINRKAIISLILGIASWVGALTIILPFVGGIWAIIDGFKALKGKTKYKKSAIIGMSLPILFYVIVVMTMTWDVVASNKWEAQLNSYIENGQYAEAQEFIAQEYAVGSLSYVDECAQLYELQGLYDEAVDLWVEYCRKEYELIDIPDYRISELNKYLNKYEAELRLETVEKVHNLINSKEMAEAEKQAAKEAQKVEEQTVKETENIAKENDLEFDVSDSEKIIADVENIQVEQQSEYEIGEEYDTSYIDVDLDNYESNQGLGLFYDENGFYTIINFPYQNSKQADKLIKFYKKVLEANVSDFVTVEYERKGILDSSMQYKQTLSSSTYKYYGEMKDGLPHGQGCVVSYNSNLGIYMPKVLGNFKNGQLDGYAIEFSVGGMFSVLGEGNYKKGLGNGDCVIYVSALNNIEDMAYGESELIYLYGVDGDQVLFDQYKNYISERKSSVGSREILILTDVPLIPVYIKATGEFKDDKMIGEWNVYYYNGMPRSEIKMDKNGETGKGTIYYPNGTIQYTGEIKDGKYHGKGTLYREDGSVEYKGNFKNGSIDN